MKKSFALLPLFVIIIAGFTGCPGKKKSQQNIKNSELSSSSDFSKEIEEKDKAVDRDMVAADDDFGADESSTKKGSGKFFKNKKIASGDGDFSSYEDDVKKAIKKKNPLSEGKVIVSPKLKSKSSSSSQSLPEKKLAGPAKKASSSSESKVTEKAKAEEKAVAKYTDEDLKKIITAIKMDSEASNSSKESKVSDISSADQQKPKTSEPQSPASTAQQDKKILNEPAKNNKLTAEAVKIPN